MTKTYVLVEQSIKTEEVLTYSKENFTGTFLGIALGSLIILMMLVCVVQMFKASKQAEGKSTN